jgi:citrate/tricarballylate utilization protein
MPRVLQGEKKLVPPLELSKLIAEAEVSRVLEICNACRYCETYCAVFPAMTRRLTFDAASAHYLANLCHNCGACLYSCQYAPPHDFGVNVPRAMARVRRKTYEAYAWPESFGSLYRNNGLAVAAACGGGITLFLLLVIATSEGLGARVQPSANFYAIFPHNTLVWMFGAVFGWAFIALSIGAVRFWRDQSPGAIESAPLAEAAGHALSLTYLGGGHGDGCNEEDDRFTTVRRIFHHFTFYGFLLCAASTATATVYHYALSLHAPYALHSAPVILGLLGGVGLLIGPAGLLWLNLRRNPLQGDPLQQPMDRAFIVLLFATSLTGLALLRWRDQAAMPSLLAVHLGCVLALFLTLPYGKFAHAVYRCAALLKWAVERRQPNRLKLASD